MFNRSAYVMQSDGIYALEGLEVDYSSHQEYHEYLNEKQFKPSLRQISAWELGYTDRILHVQSKYLDFEKNLICFQIHE